MAFLEIRRKSLLTLLVFFILVLTVVVWRFSSMLVVPVRVVEPFDPADMAGMGAGEYHYAEIQSADGVQLSLLHLPVERSKGDGADRSRIG